MVLAAIGDFIYNFYCVLYQIVAIISYTGYVLYYIIHHVTWIVLWCLQNGTAFTQMVYEDNRHLIQDTATFLAGTSYFFTSNVAKACSAVLCIGKAIWNGTIAFLSLLKWSAFGAKQSLVLIGDAVWMLFTAPYQLLALLDAMLNDGWVLLQQTVQYVGNEFVTALVAIKQIICEDVPAQSAWGLLLLALAYYYPAPLVILLNYVKEMVRSGLCLIRAKLQRPYALTVHYLSSAAHRIALRKSNERPASRADAVGSCIICLDNERSVAFIPCGHFCVCKVCARNLDYYNPVCPLCRKYIERNLEVYL